MSLEGEVFSGRPVDAATEAATNADLGLARRGDDAAFTRLVESLRRELGAHCYRRTGAVRPGPRLVVPSAARMPLGGQGPVSYRGRNVPAEVQDDVGGRNQRRGFLFVMIEHPRLTRTSSPPADPGSPAPRQRDKPIPIHPRASEHLGCTAQCPRLLDVRSSGGGHLPPAADTGSAVVSDNQPQSLERLKFLQDGPLARAVSGRGRSPTRAGHVRRNVSEVQGLPIAHVGNMALTSTFAIDGVR